ncbi:MAG TPA: thymidine kinase [Pseudoneobacillus sp.]|nr:thymidine kinase [Pseudoneobacillus sp.]
MAKLYCRYGSMGSSKSLDLIRSAYNYTERGMEVLVLTPDINTRDGIGKVASRAGLSIDAIPVGNGQSIMGVFMDYIMTYGLGPACILTDETQFFKPEQIDELSNIVDQYNIPVICYTLRGDFTGKFFPGSQRLFELADEIEEVPAICWCGKKARFSARVIDGKVVMNGEQVMVGGNESYVGLCRKHLKEGRLSYE